MEKYFKMLSPEIFTQHGKHLKDIPANAGNSSDRKVQHYHKQKQPQPLDKTFYNQKHWYPSNFSKNTHAVCVRTVFIDRYGMYLSVFFFFVVVFWRGGGGGGWLLYWGLNNMSTLVGHLCCLPKKGRKEKEEIVEEMKERCREEWGTGMKVKKQKK